MSKSILTHVLPFGGYSIPYTCGPDPKVCCQFDFKRVGDKNAACAWGIGPVFINEQNVHEK